MLKLWHRRETPVTGLTPDLMDVFDRRGYRRSPVTLPAYRQGQPNANRGKSFDIDVLEGDEVYSMIAACYANGRWAVNRNAGMITMMWRAGLRCGELTGLQAKDVNLAEGRIVVQHGKGNMRRILPLDPAACLMLGDWAEERESLGFHPAEPFFPVMVGPTAGAEVGYPYVRELVYRLGRLADVAKRVHPHGFRHTYLSWLLAKGVPLFYVKLLMGHKDLSTTQRYAHLINPALMLEEVRKIKWPTNPWGVQPSGLFAHAAALQRSQREPTA